MTALDWHNSYQIRNGNNIRFGKEIRITYGYLEMNSLFFGREKIGIRLNLVVFFIRIIPYTFSLLFDEIQKKERESYRIVHAFALV